MKGPRQSQSFLPSFGSINPLWLKIAFLVLLHPVLQDALERKDQQDDDKHSAGEESYDGPLPAV